MKDFMNFLQRFQNSVITTNNLNNPLMAQYGAFNPNNAPVDLNNAPVDLNNVLIDLNNAPVDLNNVLVNPNNDPVHFNNNVSFNNAAPNITLANNNGRSAASKLCSKGYEYVIKSFGKPNNICGQAKNFQHPEEIAAYQENYYSFIIDFLEKKQPIYNNAKIFVDNNNNNNLPVPENFNNSTAFANNNNVPVPANFNNSTAFANNNNVPVPANFNNSTAFANNNNVPVPANFNNSTAFANNNNVPVPANFNNSTAFANNNNVPVPANFNHSTAFANNNNVPVPANFNNSTVFTNNNNNVPVPANDDNNGTKPTNSLHTNNLIAVFNAFFSSPKAVPIRPTSSVSAIQPLKEFSPLSFRSQKFKCQLEKNADTTTLLFDFDTRGQMISIYKNYRQESPNFNPAEFKKRKL